MSSFYATEKSRIKKDRQKKNASKFWFGFEKSPETRENSVILIFHWYIFDSFLFTTPCVFHMLLRLCQYQLLDLVNLRGERKLQNPFPQKIHILLIRSKSFEVHTNLQWEMCNCICVVFKRSSDHNNKKQQQIEIK